MTNFSQATNHRYQQLSHLLAPRGIKRLFKPHCLSIIPEINFRDHLKLLDVGCRNGLLLFKLASFLPDYEFHGLDIDPHWIKKDQSQNKYPNLRFHCAPAEDMPFESEYFDLIVCTNALQKFPQRVRALDEMHRVLKMGGELYILEGFGKNNWKLKFDKILRQSKFINPIKKFLPRTALFRKSYFIHYIKNA